MRTRTSVFPILCLSLVLCALGASCTKSATHDASLSAYTFPTEGRSSKSAQGWFRGEPYISKVADESPEVRYVRAEQLYWMGDREAAFGDYLSILQDTPEHALTRHAVARLYGMRSVINYEARLEPVLSAITFNTVHPVTAMYLGLLGQRVHYWKWSIGQKPVEFRGDNVGLPNRWMTSPMVSPWRLLDFDRDHSIERAASIPDKTLSPSIAKDVPANYKLSRPFITSGTALSPGHFSGDGVYYMETFAHVESTVPQVYWVYGNFPAQSELLIDGVKVLERREDNYGPSKRMRRVELAPGKHRVVLKMAFQDGYRDWFDLSFLNAQGNALSGSAMRFEHTPGSEALSAAPPRLLSDQKTPAELEWTLIKPAKVKEASSMALYLTAVTALEDRASTYFGPAIDELVRRHPSFAPAYVLKSEQVQTLWEVPSQSRNTLAIKWLRQAVELDSKSLYLQRLLANWLKRRGKGRDIVKRLERNRDAAVDASTQPARLKDLRPLEDWALYVQNQGWKEDAETAWKAVLKASPNDCSAASRLQQLYYERKHMVEPSMLVKDASLCPNLTTYWVRIHPEKLPQQLELAKLQAQRRPYSSSAAKSYATALRRSGKPDDARAQLERAKDMIPYNASVRSSLIDDALASQGEGRARQRLMEAIDANGHAAWTTWRMAQLDRGMPLQDLMQDGIKVATSIAQKTSSEAQASLPQDEAYYAIDFAAKRYAEDGSGVSLTHTMVRVMTKGAIDQHGEVSIPSNAKVVVARTIKQDGSIREPEYTSGKSTLSMPGLAEGDFVELAYIQANAPSGLARTHALGTKFFFQMRDISSLHSEYVVINPSGTFLSLNNAPVAQRFDYKGQPAVRFVQKLSPKPAPERSPVNVEEFLPWVQMFNDGVTLSGMERRRKTYMESIKDNTKNSSYVTAQMALWKKNVKGLKGLERVKRLFYDVMAYVPTPAQGGGFTTDISHVLASKEGSPFLLMYRAFQDNGIPAEIFLVKNKFQIPEEHPLTEASKYTGPVLRVTIPETNEVVWIQNLGKWSMFGTLTNSMLGQPALCVTCDTPERQTIPEQAWRPNTNKVSMDAALDDKGTLTGFVQETYDGAQGAYARDMVSRSKEETKRKKLIGRVLGAHVQGATIKTYSIEHEEDLDKPLIVKISFERPHYARPAQGALVIEQTLFREPVASMYATLPSRTIPLFASYTRNNAYTLKLTLPQNKVSQVRSKTGTWEHSGPYGQFTRTVSLKDNILTLDSAFKMPIQRVSVKQYKSFQQWAINVERSSLLLMTVR